jgi:predicted secreted hydrolase
MMNSQSKPERFLVLILICLLTACAPTPSPSAELSIPDLSSMDTGLPIGFTPADATRPLEFPRDFAAHDDFRTEWWYYTGNLETPEGRPFGFELTIFRVGLLPPTKELPHDSEWFDHSLYFAHFAVSDIGGDRFFAFERYARPGPGLAGAQGEPYRVWLEDWEIAESAADVYRLHASQENLLLDLTLIDELGVILHGEDGYSRKGENATNASYYYSQPRLRAEGTIEINGERFPVRGLAWKDHEFSSGVLDQNQIGWDWFSLQFEDGPAVMLFQLRERGGGISPASSGTFIDADGRTHHVPREDFDITVQDAWQSPHTQGEYPAGWVIQLNGEDCRLEVQPRMADQEIHFSAVTYWEGAVSFEGECGGLPARGNGYVELTGYAGNLPLP